jgi:ribosomal protein S18 acetylase RimI-like enzyme
VKEVEEVHWAWARDLGWSPQHGDALCNYTLDPKGFFVGFLDKKPIGCISAVKLAKNVGFIGYYIVQAEYRGEGFGIKLWNTAMEYLKGRSIIGLDADPSQKDNYIKSGFKPCYLHQRFRGPLKECKFVKAENIVSATSVPFDKLKSYCNQYFLAPRDAYLQAFISQPKRESVVKLDKDGSILGFAVIRPGFDVTAIAPLFAENKEIAKELMDASLSTLKTGDMISLYVPDANKEALELVKQLGLTTGYACTRMYNGETPKEKLDNIFAVTSLEVS